MKTYGRVEVEPRTFLTSTHQMHRNWDQNTWTASVLSK